ncbi:MAG: VOC family protein [Methylobacteriaceae bacterium]|nr:VOC family protein [Methylobacteriaceae bacterium]MBV9246202.1 VOC family protein [Methylobacteriaceae bacterium]MBV9704481.1 VOC family protein [Methylobacteriaceae bacterium]
MTGFTLDHVGIAVPDLDAAATQFRKLGFRLTPRGYHTLPVQQDGTRPKVGTGNHCAMLTQGYIELIGITDPASPSIGRLLQALSRHAGLQLVAFGTPDAQATASALQRLGIAAAAPRPLERPIEEDGRAELARFELVEFPSEILSEGHFFAIRHATPDLLWKPGLTRHENGAASLAAVTVAVVDPADFAGRLGRLLAIEPDDRASLALARGRVDAVDGGWLADRAFDAKVAVPFIAGISVDVTDLDATARALAAGSVPFERVRASIRVAPEHACGASIEFCQAAEGAHA